MAICSVLPTDATRWACGLPGWPPRARRSTILADLAKPYLKQLAARLDLTTALTALRGAESVVIAIAAAAQVGGGGTWVGRHVDLHCTAQGKALISALSEEELGEIFGGREFAPFTSKTILSLSALKAHLAEVRACGYYVNDEEYFQGVRGVAAPIFDPLGVVVAAISVRGSSRQIPSSRLAGLGHEMVRAARDLEMARLRVRRQVRPGRIRSRVPQACNSLSLEH